MKEEWERSKNSEGGTSKRQTLLSPSSFSAALRVAPLEMSAGGAFGGARGLAPKPPEKGVFPLDHFGECKKVKN